MDVPDRAWVAAVGVLGGDTDAAEVSALDLHRRHADPGRTYHGLEHVGAVLTNVRLLARGAGLDEVTTAQVRLAACAHDVVHEGVAGEDEQASAEWARGALHDAALPDHAEPVARLVLVTVEHDPKREDVAGGVLSDADLAVLGGSPDEYAAYVAAVRAEYADVDDAAWRTGRTAVLRSLLDRPTLFRTELGHAWWEGAARRNVGHELLRLTDPR